MITYEVYFDTTAEIDGFAALLRRVINLADTNLSRHQREQRREGANLGGLYYLFEVLGLELLLLRNVGEVAIPERYDHALYLIVQGGSEGLNRVVAEQVRDLVVREGIRASVDSLSA